MREKIKVAIAGVGNCASAFIQGIEFYRERPDAYGLMHQDIGGYGPSDVEIVAAFDVAVGKVGERLDKAMFSLLNCTKRFYTGEVNNYPVIVRMGPVADGVAEHMPTYHQQDVEYVVSDEEPCDVASVLRETEAEVLINYLPVGSETAARTYAQACLDAGVSFMNAMPTFIVSDETWGQKFAEAGIPAIGDDIKSQVGATIVHRVLTRLFQQRGVNLSKTYQLNFGGNSDFYNMLSRERLTTKKLSKTNSVQSQLDIPLPADQVHISPSDYVTWLKDNKICYIHMEGLGFGEVPLSIELKLSVEDSPNSAGVAIDAVRLLKLAQQRHIGGPLLAASAYLMKSPPVQYTDSIAADYVEEFIAGSRDR